jgi:Patatin-like phospholipase
VKRAIRWPLVVAASVTALVALSQAQPIRCDHCLRAKVWQTSSDPSSFPEHAELEKFRADLGVAFSGGGTRSASATLGQLRGLKRNGWLDRVRYVAAVSGGSWAAIPFTYWKAPLDEFLGAPQTPASIDYRALLEQPNGRLAETIVGSSLFASSIREVAGIYVSSTFNSTFDSVFEEALDLFGKGRPEGGRLDKTYTRLIRDAFIKKLLGDDGDLKPGWNDQSVVQIVQDNDGRVGWSDFVKTPPERPFLVVGASMVWQRGAFPYPRLIPVEYTPLYTGARQQFGLNVGGTYVASWAYDSVRVTEDADPRMVQVWPAKDGRKFTLSEMAASSGAAPQLLLLLGAGAPAAVRNSVKRAGEVFPYYNAFAMHPNRPVVVTAPIAHGDGGFIDYFGLMPLLARHVHNVLVFVNSDDEFSRNRQFESLFQPVDIQDLGGDGTMTAVFDKERLKQVSAAFLAEQADGKPLVYCGSNWSVADNEPFNIRGYDGLNICFFYNHRVPAWERVLRAENEPVFRLVTGTAPAAEQACAGRLDNFPLFNTFGQNKPHVIQLKSAQVNLLSDLTEWIVTNPETVEAIRQVMGNVLPAPPVFTAPKPPASSSPPCAKR